MRLYEVNDHWTKFDCQCLMAKVHQTLPLDQFQLFYWSFVPQMTMFFKKLSLFCLLSCLFVTKSSICRLCIANFIIRKAPLPSSFYQVGFSRSSFTIKGHFRHFSPTPLYAGSTDFSELKLSWLIRFVIKTLWWLKSLILYSRQTLSAI